MDTESNKIELVGIVAMTHERVIGKGGDLPWHLPEDLKFFKRTTLNHPIIMGRKTYESIGRPLPKRQNIVLTRDANWSAEGVKVINHPKEIFSQELERSRVFVIGGAEIYKAYLGSLSELIVTHVSNSYEGDTYFPEFTHLFDTKMLISRATEFNIWGYK